MQDGFEVLVGEGRTFGVISSVDGPGANGLVLRGVETRGQRERDQRLQPLTSTLMTRLSPLLKEREAGGWHTLGPVP